MREGETYVPGLQIVADVTAPKISRKLRKLCPIYWKYEKSDKQNFKFLRELTLPVPIPDQEKKLS